MRVVLPLPLVPATTRVRSSRFGMAQIGQQALDADQARAGCRIG